MDKKQKTVLAVIFIAIVGFAGLWNVDLSQGYLMISDISSNSGDHVGHDVNTMGMIKNGTLSISTDGTSFTLQDIEDPSYELNVEYTGSLPANLVEGQSVSISGKMVSEGMVEANQIVMSCPSKYSE
ncbi:cytochrome c maturation protein CcmE domain-containing protein [Methanolobus profundi]|uniref:Cytochrome c-type biogenesis protein CcmE n=1 Tax=Methanolobus profundi TaxID=487685 RepID=A0A1I4NGG8_9EURY|nr:cytochrome c maturation protein CcmE [Methanolobus profundi]SFM14496.1 cytochrome c-type biogenesis protein CcmE [Methanolobus profundi]